MNESNIYNIASNDSISINALINEIRHIVTEDFKIVNENKRQSDNTTIDLDNTKILKDNPNFKFTNIRDGVFQTYNYIKNNTL